MELPSRLKDAPGANGADDGGDMGKRPVLKRNFGFISVLSFWCTVLITWEGMFIWFAIFTSDSSRHFLSYITGWLTMAGWQAVTASTASFAIFINTVVSKMLAHFEGLILVLHILGFFSVLIPLVYLSPHGDASFFTTFYCIERAIGFGMTIAYLFCLGDFDAVLESQTTLGYPFLYVFQVGTGSTPGAAVLGLIIVVLGVCSTVGALASSSRMLWSFARDRGIPFWTYFIRLNRRTSIPVYTIAFTTTISVLLSLIVLDSSVAFSNIVNLSIARLYSSCLLCCALLLWRRLQPNGIKLYSSQVGRVGPGNLLWPPVTPVVPETVNFNVLTFGATSITRAASYSLRVTTSLFAEVWCFVSGKKSYHGPVVEVEL
ncbi:putative GABA permease [Xylaria arbuscula]|nr:putative GABA permease [Xylaria arbuscula]